MRQEEISADVYNYIFETLDAEPTVSGLNAGAVATKVQKAFEQALKEAEIEL